MRHRAIATTALLAAGLLLTGCGGSGSSAKATPTGTTATTTAATTTPAASRTPAAYKLGQPQHWDHGTTTVISYRQPVLASDPPGPSLGVPTGSQWGRIDIKVCLATGSPISVSQQPWHLQFADGTQADTTGESGGDFPKPEFPQDRTVQHGMCARGGIMFPVPKGQRPAQVVYSPDSIPTPTYWDLPAK